MPYSTPELIVLGSASAVVLGDDRGVGDNILTDNTKEPDGVTLGLDD
jgi:hypothetical protein